MSWIPASWENTITSCGYSTNKHIVSILDTGCCHGFFSCSSLRLGAIIEHCMAYGICPKKVDSSKQYYSYKDNELYDDVAPFFYKSLDQMEINLKFNDEVYDAKRGCINSHFKYKNIKFSILNNLIKKFFTVSDSVDDIKHKLVDKYNIKDQETIALCYRGTDKGNELFIPNYPDMESKLVEVLEQYPNHQIIIQCDEIEFYEFMTQRGYKFIRFDELKTSVHKGSAVQHIIPIGERILSAQHFLAVVQILSRCDVLVTNSGNVGAWLCYYRGNIDKVYQFLDGWVV